MEEKKLEYPCVDALGIPIEPGALYGYSRKANGHTAIVVGEATYATNYNKISLGIKIRGRTLYDDDPRQDGQGTQRVSVHSTSLFRVDPDYFEKCEYS